MDSRVSSSLFRISLSGNGEDIFVDQIRFKRDRKCSHFDAIISMKLEELYFPLLSCRQIVSDLMRFEIVFYF